MSDTLRGKSFALYSGNKTDPLRTRPSDVVSPLHSLRLFHVELGLIEGSLLHNSYSGCGVGCGVVWRPRRLPYCLPLKGVGGEFNFFAFSFPPSLFTPFSPSYMCPSSVDVALFPALHARVDIRGERASWRRSIDFRQTFEEPGDFIVFRSSPAPTHPRSTPPFPYARKHSHSLPRETFPAVAEAVQLLSSFGDQSELFFKTAVRVKLSALFPSK